MTDYMDNGDVFVFVLIQDSRLICQICVDGLI